jgi:hypothetical protein
MDGMAVEAGDDFGVLWMAAPGGTDAARSGRVVRLTEAGRGHG